MRTRVRMMSLALALSGLAGAAQAESLEQRFHGFLERLRSAGQQISGLPLAGLAEVRQPEVRPRTDKLPVGTGEYAVFVGPGCYSCGQAVAYMKSRKLAYTVLDVASNETARQSYGLLGVKGLPVILMPTQMMVGFERKAFDETLRLDLQKAMQTAN